VAVQALQELPTWAWKTWLNLERDITAKAMKLDIWLFEGGNLRGGGKTRQGQ
jgi:hypothetical protein